MYNIYRFLEQMAPYKGYVGMAAIILLVIVAGIFFAVATIHLARLMSEKKKDNDPDSLKNRDYSKLSAKKKETILRKIISPDFVDPGPNGYCMINDGGIEYYIRCFTFSSVPKNSTFAITYADIMNFPDMISSFEVNPISESEMRHILDKHITILDSEYGSTQSDINRDRRLKGQFREANSWAEELETGENSFFKVGFLFVLVAETLADLNKRTDSFRAKALEKSIMISSCYGVQAETYLQAAPFNSEVSISSNTIDGSGINYFYLDKYSLSTLFNYTQSSYSHRDGIPLGRDLFTGDPVFFDIYDPSHDGHTILIAGKTRSGKSAMIKMLTARSSTKKGYRFVSVDSQERKGLNEGEYSEEARRMGGVSYRVSKESDFRLNIFEVFESVESVRIDNDKVHEVRTLALSDKITMTVWILLSMVQEGQDFDSMVDFVDIRSILTDCLSELYQDFGFIDKDADSLYEEDMGGMNAGRIKKIQPTMTDYYKKLLIKYRTGKNGDQDKSYRIILAGLKEYVYELYYSEETVQFFSPEQYGRLKMKPGSVRKSYQNDANYMENVIEIRGSRSYYDGQSTMYAPAECPFINYDISGLVGPEKKLARQILIDYINEYHIKANVKGIKGRDKLVVILDEAKENFENKFARATIDVAVRQAAKMNVGIILSSQTLRGYEDYPETADIFKNAAAKFVFKQDYTDRDWLKSSLHLTNTQADFIVNSLGGESATTQGGNKSKHKGEVCLIDGKNVCFLKVDYLRTTEQYIVETDPKELSRLYSLKNDKAV